MKWLLVIALSLISGSFYAQNVELNALLEQVYEDDQAIRKDAFKFFQAKPEELIAYQQSLDSVDRSNQQIVFGILDSIGWPTNLSDAANRAIFIVIDHADLDEQKKYLPLVKEQHEKNVIEKDAYPTLLDRVLMKSGKEQIYGTQTFSQNKSGGEVFIYVWPIENPKGVDSLRAEVGLPPMAEYIEMVSSAYKQPCYWDKDLKIEDINVKIK